MSTKKFNKNHFSVIFFEKASAELL